MHNHRKLLILTAALALLGAGCAKAGSPISRQIDTPQTNPAGSKSVGISGKEDPCKVFTKNDGSPIFTVADATTAFSGDWVQDSDFNKWGDWGGDGVKGACEMRIRHPKPWRAGELRYILFTSYTSATWNSYMENKEKIKPHAYRDIPGLGDVAFQRVGGFPEIFASKGSSYLKFSCLPQENCNDEKRISVMRTILDRLP